jgi:transposase
MYLRYTRATGFSTSLNGLRPIIPHFLPKTVSRKQQHFSQETCNICLSFSFGIPLHFRCVMHRAVRKECSQLCFQIISFAIVTSLMRCIASREIGSPPLLMKAIRRLLNLWLTHDILSLRTSSRRFSFFSRSIAVIEGSRFLSLSDDLRIDQLTPTATALLVQAVSTQKASCCPLCGQSSQQIHSRYGRAVADVPCGARPVSLHLAVRRFFCRTKSCPRQIFTDRLPAGVQPSARMTNRLRTILQVLGLVTGGEAGARLAPSLGIQAAPTTFLRCLRALPSPAVPHVRVLGLDDWAYKRGYTYGTILVDLERHRVIDWLPDRENTPVQAWLRAHPEIEVISRDRAGTYADAARQAAPQAVQVADRFHLVKNGREKVQAWLDRKQACLPQVEQSTAHAVLWPLLSEQKEHSPSIGSAQVPPPVAVQLSARERLKQQGRKKRSARSEQVRALRQQGMSHCAIADALGISRPTARRFLAAEQFPEQSARPRDPRKSGGAPYLRERWLAGCQTGRQLFREATARGYAGSQAQLERVTTQWRTQLPPPARMKVTPPVPSPPRQQRLSLHKARLALRAARRQTDQATTAAD